MKESPLTRAQSYCTLESIQSAAKLISPVFHVTAMRRKSSLCRVTLRTNATRTTQHVLTLLQWQQATYGAIIPYLQTYYDLRYAIVSLVFLSPFVGYNMSALLNNSIHMKFGQRGVALIGPSCHLVAYIVIAVHPLVQKRLDDMFKLSLTTHSDPFLF